MTEKLLLCFHWGNGVVKHSLTLLFSGVKMLPVCDLRSVIVRDAGGHSVRDHSWRGN